MGDTIDEERVVLNEGQCVDVGGGGSKFWGIRFLVVLPFEI